MTISGRRRKIKFFAAGPIIGVRCFNKCDKYNILFMMDVHDGDTTYLIEIYIHDGEDDIEIRFLDIDHWHFMYRGSYIYSGYW